MLGTINAIGVGTAPLYPKQATAGAPLDPLILPGDTNPPILFEPPPGLTAGDLEVWIIATGGTHWGGCQVWISLDGSTYAYAGTIYRGGRQGLLTAALPSHADPDASSMLSVDLSQSQGQLLSGSLADADAFVTLCYCDGELLAFETATPTSYSLTGDGAIQGPAYVAGSWPGSPAASQSIERYIFATAVTFPAGLAGSYGACGTAGTAATTFTIAKNGSAVGTMDFAAGIF